ncbi:hypothetical protein EDM22_13070 [Agromyces tardus]|jgi:hypothetical protein|uniref:Uncharacterized protein n=1 Tax=Agromyces tardus TaxID=2583849 RepID=A0A3M8A6W7_9MICO|nr:hypothetical protein [Agromyces tardus]RNB46924.1 hypothetical protein EDM22_13070 [Agromyces tardus]
MDTDLFVHFAEIAGIFVGFGALIGLRSTRVTDLHDVVYLKSVLALGVWVVIFALLPIVVSRYGVDDHALWLSCAAAALVIWVVGVFGLNRMAEWRAFNRSQDLEPVDRFFPVIGLPLHLITAGSLVLIVIGIRPAIDEALYVTALCAGIVFGGYALLVSVLSRPPVSASDRTPPVE